MNTLKKYVGILMMFTLLVGFTSCEDDEDIFDDLVGRTWVGDLGFGANRDPIESAILLDGDGFGMDYQVFYQDGARVNDYRLRWWVDYGTLYLDYGNEFGILEIREVRVNGRYLRGNLYDSTGFYGDIELKME